ncbi:MAG TPA: FHA domain-containing protein [Chloroflexota bacterium]|nr:FHA domain-containing protein [Chloroflexota bacterium]
MTTCPQCGTQNLPGMAYCEHCGSPLNTPEETPAPPPAPAADAGAADTIAQAQAMLDQLNAGDRAAPVDQATAASPDAAPAADQANQAAAPLDQAPAQSADAAVPPDLADVADQSTPPAGAGFPQTAPPVAASAEPVMTITFGDGSQFTVQDDVTNVGRSDVAQSWHPELDVIPYGGGAPDFGVSRHQAVIQRTDNSFTVLDVGSTNGTFVNGKILEYNKPVELHDGDALAFGAFNGKVGIR